MDLLSSISDLFPKYFIQSETLICNRNIIKMQLHVIVSDNYIQLFFIQNNSGKLKIITYLNLLGRMINYVFFLGCWFFK